MAVKRPGPPPPMSISTNKENDLVVKENEENNHGDLDKVMKKIEDRLFLGRTTALKVFDTFDVDKDGFIFNSSF